MYWIGFQLYKTEAIPQSEQFTQTRYETIQGNSVKFYFYKEEAEDLRFKFGKFYRYRYHVYIVRAYFNDDLPDVITRFNNLKFYVRADSFLIRNDKIVVDILAEIYTSYLIDVLKREIV